jgi:predicted small lipoprotein YifL
MRMLVVFVAALSVAGCKKKEPVEEPQAEEGAGEDPSALAPSEDHEPDVELPPADPYAGFSEEQKLEKAKEIFAEAEGLAEAGDWGGAAKKYEEAYYLVPGKHGFAFKVGTAAHKAGECAMAEQYLQHFQSYADPKKHAKQLKEAKKILAKTAGCGGG